MQLTSRGIASALRLMPDVAPTLRARAVAGVRMKQCQSANRPQNAGHGS